MNIMKEVLIDKCKFNNRINTLVSVKDIEYGNFGDLLAKYIVEELSGLKVDKYTFDNRYHLCAIGSVLNRKEICSNAVVWGSGFLAYQSWLKIKLTKIREMFRNNNGKPYFLAVRGKKTRDILVSAGYNCPEIYGDPALLMPRIYECKNKKIYSVGIVLHNKHKSLEYMFKNIEGVKFIDINRKYDDITGFVDDISSCEKILSSSLHGVIIANCYRIPCARLIIEGAPLTKNVERDNFKFDDYVSGLNANRVEVNKKDYILQTVKIKKECILTYGDLNKYNNLFEYPEFKIDLSKLVSSLFQRPFLSKKYKDADFII